MKQSKFKELFGFGKGWGTIIYCLLMFWLYAGMVNDSSNIVAPAVAEKLGVPAGNVLQMGTVAALIEGTTDVAYTVLYDIDLLGDEYVSILIAESPHYVYMLKSNPLAKRKSIKIEELKQSEFISISPLKTPSYSAAIAMLCEEKGFQPNITYFTQSAASLTFNLTTDNEVFIADCFYKDFDNPMIVAVPLKDTVSGLVMGYKKEHNNRVLSAFLDAAREYGQSHQI
ncbi:MAG: hypothetical protein IKF90_19770 [Parasporobacterium sp.]|nr:hypothetical protein [Parasporobacterium sp.]